VAPAFPFVWFSSQGQNANSTANICLLLWQVYQAEKTFTETLANIDQQFFKATNPVNGALFIQGTLHGVGKGKRAGF
jgi:hypothetical protein